MSSAKKRGRRLETLGNTWRQASFWDKCYVLGYVTILAGIFVAGTNPPLLILIEEPVYNRLLWTYISFSILFFGAIIALYGYLKQLSYAGNTASPQHPPITTADYQVDDLFLLGRSDNLDRVLANLRSGISIVLGIGSGIMLWMLQLGRELTYAESALLYASIVLVLSSAAAVMASFADFSVVSYGSILREDLVPTTKSTEVFLEQLKEVLSKKRKTTARMRKWVGGGIVLFVIIAGIGLVWPAYGNLSSLPIVLITAGSISFALFISLAYLFAVAMMTTFHVFPVEAEEQEEDMST